MNEEDPRSRLPLGRGAGVLFVTVPHVSDDRRAVTVLDL